MTVSSGEQTVRILLVESDASVRQFALDTLNDHAELRTAVTEGETLADAAAALDSMEFDVVLLGAHFRDGDVIEWMAAPNRHRHQPPVILLGAEAARGREAARSGVEVYALAPLGDGPRLADAIRHATERARVESDLRQTKVALREREEQLHHAQKMEAIGRLAGGIAHDFRNVLTIIMGASEKLLDELRDDDSRKKVHAISESAVRATELANRLLMFSRQQAPAPSVLALGDIISGTEPLLRALVGETIEFRTHCAANAGLVRVDRTEIEQVLFNLAVNARDAMPTGGRLSIEIRSVDAGSRVAVEVTDTGMGMSAETRARAFEPFFTTKEIGRGSGLGLSTVHGIVSNAGGSIAIDSQPGSGTRVSVFLPSVTEPAPVARPVIDSTAEPPRGHETVLLVEDQDDVRELVKDMLEGAGYRVFEAGRPSLAEKISAELEGPIDLLLTDIVMPEMSGPQLATKILQERSSTKVLLMSGYSEEGATASGETVPDQEFELIAKPFKRRVLLRRMRDLLDGPAASIA